MHEMQRQREESTTNQAHGVVEGTLPPSPGSAGGAERFPPSPGWGRKGAVLAGLLVLVVAAVCVRLGFWQLDRLAQRQARNAHLEQALALPAISLGGGTLREIERDPAAYLNRRVHARGVYDPGGEVLLRGRTHQGQPGVHLVTPLRIADVDAAVLVNRGWAPAPDAATLDPAPLSEIGQRDVEGIIQLVPSPPEGGTPVEIETASGRVLTLRRLDLQALRARAAQRLAPIYIQQLPDPSPSDAPTPVRIPLPELTEGPHLGYAVQWFSFAAIFVIGYAVVLLRRRLPAR